MQTEEFLAKLNNAQKGWGLWVNRQNIHENHVGQYSFENDCLPKNFIHVGSLEKLAHLRQAYLLEKTNEKASEEKLSEEWADVFLSQWQMQA